MQTLEERIKQRRSQMLIHSYLYYYLDDPLISDDLWQRWADELTELQHGFITLNGNCKIGFYDEDFANWDGTTGMHLSQDQWVRDKAYQLRLSIDKSLKGV